MTCREATCIRRPKEGPAAVQGLDRGVMQARIRDALLHASDDTLRAVCAVLAAGDAGR